MGLIPQIWGNATWGKIGLVVPNMLPYLHSKNQKDSRRRFRDIVLRTDRQDGQTDGPETIGPPLRGSKKGARPFSVLLKYHISRHIFGYSFKMLF